MTYEHLITKREFILLDCISGSRAYNLHLPESDTDKKGVFFAPKRDFYGFGYQEQLNNNSNDEVYFEIKRFIELLLKNNPNILELLSTPKSHILFKHPIVDLIQPNDFLSKLCRDTFAGYAQTQVKKARGLNKKINNPIDKTRKSILDFCYVIQGNGSISLNSWLQQNELLQENCGLVNVEHFRNVYLIYSRYDKQDSRTFNGIVSGANADDVQLSLVPKGMLPSGTMTFNKDAYSIYCRNYKEYLEWEEKRNQKRYENTLSHGKNYDAKNMMHTFRLLNMAEEIALYHEVRVHRADRKFLLNIRSGNFEFQELMDMIEAKMHRIDELYKISSLPEQPNTEKAEALLYQIRDELYKS